MSTLIQGGYVIANDGEEHVLIENGVVVFEDDTITHVGKSYSGNVDERIDARGKIVSPGFINTHTHSFAPLPIGQTDICIDDDFNFSYQNPNLALRPIKDRFDVRQISDKNLKALSKWSLCNYLKSGCTTIVGVETGEESDVQLYGELGARA